jgi:surface protein
VSKVTEVESSTPKAFETKFELLDALSKYYFNPSKNNVDIKRTYGHPIGEWDVSKIQDFKALFFCLNDFNEDIQSWDVSSVTDMSAMFRGKKFNQDISSWNTSQVRDMSSMFENAKSFNQDLSLWDISEVSRMSSMFEGAVSFNRDLSSWDTSQVTDMKYMFLRAHAFNQDVSSWRTSKVTSMYGMFWDAQSFNQDLSGWDMSKVTEVETSTPKAFETTSELKNAVFKYYFNPSEENVDIKRTYGHPIGKWDVSKIQDFYSLFHHLTDFNEDIQSWDVSSVTARKLDQGVSDWTGL